MGETWKSRAENPRAKEAREVTQMWKSMKKSGFTREDIREQTYKTSPSTYTLLRIATLYLEGKPTKAIVDVTGLARNTVNRLRETRFSSRLQEKIEEIRRAELKKYMT